MKNCPYCNEPGYFYFSVSSKTYYRCNGCDLIYREQRESREKLLAYYREGYFERYPYNELEIKRENIFYHILDLIEAEGKKGRFLDVGSGCGSLLTSAREKGWEVEGIEPSLRSVKIARDQNGLNVFLGTLSEYQSDHLFDVITFVNVLEHSLSPWQEIEKAKALLKPDGIIYLRFPNVFLHARLYIHASKWGLGERIKKYLVFHQYCFTPRFIMGLLKDFGLPHSVVYNSPPSMGDPNKLFSDDASAQRLKMFSSFFAEKIRLISYGKVLMGTSLEILASRNPSLSGEIK